MTSSKVENPKIFISYSHDSDEHKKKVLDFSEKLRADGIDTCIDQYSLWPQEGWPRWMERHLRGAQSVLLICTKTYFLRVTGQEEPGKGKGVCWEANLIYNDLYSKKVESGKYLPILFSDCKEEDIPAPLKGHSFFLVDTDKGYEDLYRFLTNQPPVQPGKVGPLKKLPLIKPLKDRVVSESYAESLSLVTESKAIKKVFISYPHGDPAEENLARFLYDQLVKAGHDSFIDIGMKGGTDWAKEIKDRIRWCDYLVVLISENSMDSEMVQFEVRLATQHRKRFGVPKIIPIRLHYFGPLEYELDLSIGGLQFIKWEATEDSKRVLQEIIRVLTDETPEDGKKWEQVGGLRMEQEPRLVNDKLRPRASVDPRAASIPGGTIRSNDPYYLARNVDNDVINIADNIGETLVIKAPRQMGKSSLLLHYLSKCREAGKEMVFIDFSIFSADDFSTYPVFLSKIIQIFLRRLRIKIDDIPKIDSQAEATWFIEDYILSKIKTPLVIAFDEADRIFGHAYQTDFFTMLRLWHNNRADITLPWENADLALSISTEPYLLINEDDRSPFNVGLVVELEPFSLEECIELNGKYDDLLSRSQVEQLWELLHGHPYLTRLAYYRMLCSNKIGFDTLVEKAAEERGPFGDHLRTLLAKIHENTDFLNAFKQAIQNGKVDNKDIYYRLYGAGLVRKENNRINPANLLYARYFKKVI